MSKKVHQETLLEFSHLNITPESVSGTDLLEAFNNLGINTGNVGKLTIDAWFGTDCKATKKMLQWLCKYLNQDNVLTAQENEEYELLRQNNALLSDKQYNDGLSEMLQDYSRILDYEKNMFEVESMENKLKTLINNEESLEAVSNLHEDIKSKLLKKLNKVHEKEIMYNLQKKVEHDKCVELSMALDEEHEKLEQQIVRYAEHLNEYDHATQCKFISNIPTTQYDQLYQKIIYYLGVFLKQECDNLPKLEMMTKSARKRLLQNTNGIDDVDQLEILRRRIAKSIRNYTKAQAAKEGIKAQIEFFNDLDINAILMSQPGEDSFMFFLESNIFSHETLLHQLYLAIESVAQKTADALVDRPKLNMLEHLIEVKRQKLDNLKETDLKIKSVLVAHIVLYLLLNKEKTNIQSTDKFFRNVHHYISNNLYNCQLRTETTIEVINNYHLHQKLPIEQKLAIINVKKNLLTENLEDSNSIIDLINNFNNEYHRIEQQAFFGDYTEHRQFTKKKEKEMEVLQEFLISGPTSQIVAVPNKLFEVFNQMNELFNKQEAALKSCIRIMNDAEKKLSKNNWFKMRRLLWMWYIVEPKIVLRVINQIETAVKQARNQI